MNAIQRGQREMGGPQQDPNGRGKEEVCASAPGKMTSHPSVSLPKGQPGFGVITDLFHRNPQGICPHGHHLCHFHGHHLVNPAMCSPSAASKRSQVRSGSGPRPPCCTRGNPTTRCDVPVGPCVKLSVGQHPPDQG